MSNKPLTIMLTGSRETGQYAETIKAFFDNAIFAALTDANLLPDRFHKGKVQFLVGDAHGADDIAIKQSLHPADAVKVCYVGEKPRVTMKSNFEAFSNEEWSSYIDRDKFMMDSADVVILARINDSSGTTRNLQQAEEEGKKIYLMDIHSSVV